MTDRDPERDADEAAGPARYTVNDRRWWVPHDGGEAPAPSTPERKPTYVENLETQLAEREQLMRRYAAEHRDALNDLEQAKARIERESRRELARATRGIVLELLPAVDDLERALAAARERGGDGALRDGVELVHRAFLNRLERLGVTRFDPSGEPFDPARHEAVATVPVHEPERDGAVVGLVRPGYLIGDDVLRPAEVAVGKLAS